jgi:NAD(P)-dependent dehydrogenase (short-subunit alcohol dehydrogenase family)
VVTHKGGLLPNRISSFLSNESALPALRNPGGGGGGADARVRAVYTPWGAYGLSKLAGILHARRLARRSSPPGVLCVSVHPGIAPTKLARNMGVAGGVLVALEGALGLTVEAAGQRVMEAATSPAVTNGAYYEGVGPVCTLCSLRRLRCGCSNTASTAHGWFPSSLARLGLIVLAGVFTRSAGYPICGVIVERETAPVKSALSGPNKP